MDLTAGTYEANIYSEISSLMQDQTSSLPASYQKMYLEMHRKRIFPICKFHHIKTQVNPIPTSRYKRKPSVQYIAASMSPPQENRPQCFLILPFNRALFLAANNRQTQNHRVPPPRPSRYRAVG